jgi:FkbM family methyltransferase
MKIKKLNVVFKVDPFYFPSGHSKNYLRFWKLVRTGSWEKETFQIFKRFLSKEKSYIDLGSWIGPTVLFGSYLAKRGYAIEPDNVAREILEHNLNLNREIKKKVKIFDFCISDKRGYEYLGKKFGGFGEGDSTSSIFIKNNGQKVRSITLNEFIKNEKITDCNFIKMDVEGAEIKILPNIKSYLKKEKPTLHLSIHPWLVKDLKEYAKIMTKSVEDYGNIFTNKGVKISRQEFNEKILSKKYFMGFEVVITDKNWQTK